MGLQNVNISALQPTDEWVKMVAKTATRPNFDGHFGQWSEVVIFCISWRFGPFWRFFSFSGALPPQGETHSVRLECPSNCLVVRGPPPHSENLISGQLQHKFSNFCLKYLTQFFYFCFFGISGCFMPFWVLLLPRLKYFSCLLHTQMWVKQGDTTPLSILVWGSLALTLPLSHVPGPQHMIGLAERARATFLQKGTHLQFCQNVD